MGDARTSFWKRNSSFRKVKTEVAPWREPIEREHENLSHDYCLCGQRRKLVRNDREMILPEKEQTVPKQRRRCTEEQDIPEETKETKPSGPGVNSA